MLSAESQGEKLIARTLDNVPAEAREMVRYALELAIADTSGANDPLRDDPPKTTSDPTPQPRK